MGVLDAIPGGIPEQIGRSRPRPEAPRPLRLGNGVVQRAMIKALVDADRPMDVGEAHRAVEELLGYPVSRDSVNSCLSTGAPCGAAPFQARRAGPVPARAVSLRGVAAPAATLRLLVRGPAA
jgi:hypothetical protein